MAFKLRVRCISFALAASLLPVSRGVPAEPVAPAEALAPYVNDDTFVAAYFNLSALPKSDKGNEGNLLAVLPFLDDDTAAVFLVLQGVDQLARGAHEAGADALYVVAGLADANQQGGPVVILQLRKGAARDAAAKVTTALGQMGPWAKSVEARPHGEAFVLVGRPTTLDRYVAFTKGDRKDLLGPLGKLSDGGAVMAAVFCPGPDFRRVVRELWPELPGALAPLRGELADRWLHLEASLSGLPNANPQIAIETTDADAAELFAKLWRDLPAATKSFGGDTKSQEQAQGYAQVLVDALPATVEGTRVNLALPTDKDEVAKFQTVLGEAADASMQSARVKDRMNKFKNLALACLNHEATKRMLPPPAILDKEGRPLLSWRVAILPYLGEMELYKQFHLDEPWDSPHNRSLVEKMPNVYSESDPKLAKIIGVGKTTYQLPVAPETIFFQKVGTPVRDITDGLGRTILIVDVEPSRAVEWTKPADWEVNVQEPLKGVEGDNRRMFIAAFGDGHIEAIPSNVEVGKLRGLLTRAGRERFDWP